MSLEVEINTANDPKGNRLVVLKMGESISIIPAKDAIDIGNALITAGMAGETIEGESHDV